MTTHPTPHVDEPDHAAVARLWDGVDAVVDRTGSLRDLRASSLTRSR